MQSTALRLNGPPARRRPRPHLCQLPLREFLGATRRIEVLPQVVQVLGAVAFGLLLCAHLRPGPAERQEQEAAGKVRMPGAPKHTAQTAGQVRVTGAKSQGCTTTTPSPGCAPKMQACSRHARCRPLPAHLLVYRHVLAPRALQKQRVEAVLGLRLLQVVLHLVRLIREGLTRMDAGRGLGGLVGMGCCKGCTAGRGDQCGALPAASYLWPASPGCTCTPPACCPA
jgi:hypothetical protein